MRSGDPLRPGGFPAGTARSIMGCRWRPMDLLERQAPLAILEQALADARAGEGRLVLVSGEAGIGKTSLVEHFCTRQRGQRTLRGACEALFAPRPLGPFHDIAAQLGGRLAAALDGGAGRPVLLPLLLDEIRHVGTAVVVVEDVHWADEATLDALKFLGRRIQSTSALLILTYRDDELDRRHPLRAVLGAVATGRAVRRIAVPALSIAAVRRLVGDAPLDPATVHGRTGGNPFFVTEVLAAGGAVPEAVRDIVLARMARLDEAGRDLLETAAVVGARSAAGLLRAVLGPAARSAEACIGLGLLRSEGPYLAFRHELARQAVLAGVAPPRLAELHARVLAGLVATRESDAALLAHHADGAGDAEAVRRHAPAAAGQASAVGSHREAAAQYARALRYAGPDRAEERAGLLEGFAEACTVLDRQHEAAEARREAADLRGRLGDRLGEGANLAALAWPLVRAGRNAEADAASRHAIAVLEPLGPGRELAAALRMQAHLRMLDRDKAAAIAWGRRAIAMAEAIGDAQTVAAAHIVVGTAMLVADDPRGRAHLDRSLAISNAEGFDELVALAYLNLGSAYGEQYRFTEAERFLSAGAAYAAERDLDHVLHYVQAWLALTHLYQGRWSEAADAALAVIHGSEVAVVSRIMALVALGRVRARRGDPGLEVLDEALALAEGTGTLQRLAPVRAARAEAAFLAGDPDRAAVEAEAAWDLAVAHRHPWHTGEFAFWRWPRGSNPPNWVARPFLLQIRGAWREAAAAWDERGCPYERARALADGDEAARREALAVFDRLGAKAAGDLLRRRMRSEGATRVPRGPIAATRDSALGLTPRQAEIWP